MTPRPRQAALAERPYYHTTLALMSNPPKQDKTMQGHRQWLNPALIEMRKR